MKKRALVGIATMAVAAALVPVGGVQSTARADEQLVDASAVTGTVLTDIEGHVEPVAGAEVTVWWVPGADTAPVGSELPIETIAVTETQANGSYELALDATPEMQEAAERNGGTLNLEVGVVDDELDKIDTSTVTRELGDGGEWTLPDPETAEIADVDVSSAALKGPARPTTKEAPRGPQFVLSASSEDAPLAKKDNRAKGATSLEADTGRTYCSFIVTGRPQRPVNVIEFHNAANSNARWTYGQKADSDIDGAIDYSGDGGWKASGSASISNSQTSSVYRYTDAVANNYGTTNFEFVDGYYKATWGGGSNICYGSSITVNTKSKRAVSWVQSVGSNRNAGSEFIGCASSPQKDHRSDYPVNTGFARNTSSASKIGGAVDLGVLKVGAQSGFSIELDIRWDSKRGRGIWLCGTNYYPRTAGVIHAQNRP